MTKSKFTESQLKKIGILVEKLNIPSIISILTMELDEDSVTVTSLVELKEIQSEMQREQGPAKK